MKVFLIGFMGSGKTTAGKKLASKLNKDFLDIDQRIEKDTGTSIKKIFEIQGEQHFRHLESKYLRDLGGTTNLVVSTGGGLPCHSGNMEYMNKAGVTVYLEMKPEELFSRLQQNSEKRPLLKGKTEAEMLEFIRDKLNKREAFYNRAQIKTNGFNLNINELVSKIKKIEQ
jgi:shikimate kinase